MIPIRFHQHTLTNTNPVAVNMAVHYDPSHLKAIGTQCKNKLPPASAVQAMYLYELQRESEVEALFHGQIFRLAKAEEETQTHSSRIHHLEAQTKALHKKLTTNDLSARLSTSAVRTEALQAKLSEHTLRLDEQATRLATLETPAAAANPPSFLLSEDIHTLKTSLGKADAEIQTLFDERDALITLLNASNSRIDKLEDLVRALTLQKTSPASAAESVQLLPLKAKNGEVVDLVVPKGLGFRTFVPGKRANGSPAGEPRVQLLKEKNGENGENVDPAMATKGKGFVSLSRDEIRAFVPGEPWVLAESNTAAAALRSGEKLGGREVVW